MSASNLPQSQPRRRTGLVFDSFYMQHEVFRGPELPARIIAVGEGLARAGLLDHLVPISPRDAVESEICLVHSPAYFRQVRNEVSLGAGELSTGDTELSERSFDVACRATGGVLQAVDAVIRGEVTRAFCATRPPGHHATPAAGMGFCLFNHIAIAARYARHIHKLQRILIVDWDIHHGNGTQDTFYRDGSVLFFSSHQWPLFPGTGKRREKGAGPAKGLIVNAPLPAGSGYADIWKEMRTRIAPLLPTFKPELILISAGFDAHRTDPLGDFTLDDRDFAQLTRHVMEWADQYAQGRLVSILEGGYNLATLGNTVAAHVAALASDDP